MKSRIPILGALVVAACGGQTPAPPATQSPASGAPAATVAATPAATGGAEFGVPECDDYLNKYLACIETNVPEASRAMLRQQLEQTRDQWRQDASNAEGRSALSVGCRAARDAAKGAMAAYGCTF